MNFRVLVFLIALCLARAAFCGRAGWQDDGFGPSAEAGVPDNTASLALLVQVENIKDGFAPLLQTEGYGNWQSVPAGTRGPYGGAASHLFRNRISLGRIEAGGDIFFKCREDEQARSWCRSTLLCEDEDKNVLLKITISRPSPAVLLSTTSDSITLFLGKGATIFSAMALPEGDGAKIVNLIAAKTQFDNEDAGSGTGEMDWALVWAGKDSKIKSTRFPWIMTGLGAPAVGWDGLGKRLYEADMPVLLVFSEPPAELSGGDGIYIKFDAFQPKAERHIAVMPLYGNDFPASAETEKWRAGLPEHVLGRCRFWNEVLSRFPVDVNETYSVDPEKGVITIENRFEYIALREDGAPCAPVPPMLALAAEFGFPAEFSAPLSDCDYFTHLGPLKLVKGADSWRCNVSGIYRYVIERRRLGEIPHRAGAVSRALAGEVRKILAAGHLAPWAMIARQGSTEYNGNSGEEFVWSNPAEILWALASVLPLLTDADLIRETKNYMLRELEKYPAWESAHLPIGEGARRERYRFDPQEEQRLVSAVQRRNFFINKRLIPPETLYYLAACCEAAPEALDVLRAGEPRVVERVLEPYFFMSDWAGLGWFAWKNDRSWTMNWRGQGGVLEANAGFAAAIGAIRLATALGLTENIDELWGFYARMAALRCGLAKIAQYRYSRRYYELPEDPAWMLNEYTYAPTGGWGTEGTIFVADWKTPLDDVRQALICGPAKVDLRFRLFNRGLVPYFRKAVPELGRLAKDFFPREIETMVKWIEWNSPDWYFAYTDSWLGGDGQECLPAEDAHQTFMAKALVLGETPEKLEWYCDVPWVERGDLYYLDKLRETIHAYAGAQWR